jgi:hypothetical protein
MDNAVPFLTRFFQAWADDIEVPETDNRIPTEEE